MKFITTFTKKHILALLVSSLIFVILTILVFYTNHPVELDESITHFLFSHYALQHPQLLLDSWQRPLFAILTLPFAQFNFETFRLFNVLCAVLTAFFVYLIAKKMNFKNAELAIIFVIFCPLYFGVSISGLTEILFSLVLIISIYFWLNNSFIVALIVASFLPYSRQEGFIIVGLYSLFVVAQKKLRIFIPWIFLGTLIMSVIAYIYNTNPFWMVQTFWSHNYKYGNGSIFFFTNQIPGALGLLEFLYFCVGILALITISQQGFYPLIFLLIIFLSLLCTYSLLWWKGLFATLNLARYINTILPITSLFILLGFNTIHQKIVKYKLLQSLLFLITVIIVIITPFRKYHLPIPIPTNHLNIQKAAKWFKTSQFSHHKLYACDNLLMFYLDEDPFNQNIFEIINSQSLNTIPKDSIVIWDSYCISELSLSEKIFHDLPNFEYIQTFSENMDITLNDYNNVSIYKISR